MFHVGFHTIEMFVELLLELINQLILLLLKIFFKKCNLHLKLISLFSLWDYESVKVFR